MDLYQEAMVETNQDTPWGPPAMPDLNPRTSNRSETNKIEEKFCTLPRRWLTVPSSNDPESNKITNEGISTMEGPPDIKNQPGYAVRPKSMCLPGYSGYEQQDQPADVKVEEYYDYLPCTVGQNRVLGTTCQPQQSQRSITGGGTTGAHNRRQRARRNPVQRNPVQRAASRLYRAGGTTDALVQNTMRDCVGPEFVVRAGLPNKQLTMPDCKGAKKTVTVIMLNGQKLDVLCNPSTTTAGQLFEMIIQKEHIEENFMLGLSSLIAGDFVFLPSDTRICKAFQPGNLQNISLTLFMRVRFFLPSLRGIRGSQARHLLYLQLRRSILEHQLPCSFTQLIDLNGLALQAEFGDYNEREHGTRDYFLLEHYVPETMSSVIEDQKRLRHELVKCHISKQGLDIEKAEEDFIIIAQTLPQYGGHFYTATWMLKDNNHKDVWLYINAQGINLYERGPSTSHNGPLIYEMFEWRSIQTLCYSKHYLCILPHNALMHGSKLKKYKLKMDHKKSYFTFRLASLHHQFFIRLRTEYTSLQSLSQQFGIPLKDMKNETNSLYKLEALTNHEYCTIDNVNADTEFKIDFRASQSNNNSLHSGHSGRSGHSGHSAFSGHSRLVKRRMSKSVEDLHSDNVNEVFQNKENEFPKTNNSLVLQSRYLAGLPIEAINMNLKGYNSMEPRVSRSMETVNLLNNHDYLEEMSLQSVSLHCSSDSISKSPVNEAYIIDSTIKSSSQQFLPDFQESLSESLLDKLNAMSFAEERIMSTVLVERDSKGSLGMQITEGSDGNVYVQSVILGGPAHLTGNILSGDQIVGVDNQSLLGLKYHEALNLLKTTTLRVEFILSRMVPNKGKLLSTSSLKYPKLKGRMNLSNINDSHSDHTQNYYESLSNRVLQYSKSISSPVEKYLTENCYDTSNLRKNLGEVEYHKHIRYEVEPEHNNIMTKKRLTPKSVEKHSLDKTVSKSCTQLYNDNNKAVVVKLIPKKIDKCQFQSLDRKLIKDMKNKNENIPMPRSLGLSRKWRGPVRYPVTPIKKGIEDKETSDNFIFPASDEEQVFI